MAKKEGSGVKLSKKWLLASRRRSVGEKTS